MKTMASQAKFCTELIVLSFFQKNSHNKNARFQKLLLLSWVFFLNHGSLPVTTFITFFSRYVKETEKHSIEEHFF